MDSTNRYARDWALAGAPHGAVVIAQRQTAGRGRRGRGWSSAPGAGLWLSMVIRPQMAQADWPLIPLQTALAGADACQAACAADVLIKWPNDLVLGGRKIAGILVERAGDAAVIGIGINVRQRPEDFPGELREKATSLEMALGRQVSTAALEAALLGALERRVDTPDFLDEYARRCVTVGRRVRVEAVDTAFDGKAVGVDGMGALLVQTDGGDIRQVLAGDVSVRGLMGYV